MYIHPEQKPRRNIFSAFEKARDIFFVRAALELVLLVSLIVGYFFLARQASAIYPVVVRSTSQHTFVGVPKEYKVNMDELFIMSKEAVEALFTQTDKGFPLDLLNEYFSREELLDVQRKLGKTKAVQTASVTGFFFYDIKPKGISACLQLNVTRTDESMITDTVGYYVVQLRQRPERTTRNPTGWYIKQLIPIEKPDYIKFRVEKLGPALEESTEKNAVLDPKRLDLEK